MDEMDSVDGLALRAGEGERKRRAEDENEIEDEAGGHLGELTSIRGRAQGTGQIAGRCSVSAGPPAVLEGDEVRDEGGTTSRSFLEGRPVVSPAPSGGGEGEC